MIMKRIIYIISAALLLLSCNKEVLLTTEKEGGILVVGTAGGSVSVLVETSGVWYAETSEDWIEVSGEYRKDKGSFVVSYRSNESTDGDRRFNREGCIRVRTYDGAVIMNVRLRQHGLEPFMEIPDALISTQAGKYSVPVFTNLTDRERASVVCSSTSSSISGAIWGKSGEEIVFDAADGTENTVISVTFTDAWGLEYKFEGTINRGNGL